MLILLKFQQILASNEAALAYLRISFFKCWRSSWMEFRSIEYILECGPLKDLFYHA